MERSRRKKRADKVAGPPGREVISLLKGFFASLINVREAKKLCKMADSGLDSHM